MLCCTRFSGIVPSQSIGKVGAGTDRSPAGLAASQNVNRKHALAQAFGGRAADCQEQADVLAWKTSPRLCEFPECSLAW